ncbi:SDR family NAD(P)-dependent oxidoreductase [Pseudomaricurvus sp. HS19]|uniref:SDR family NAD(P)-dependent oxidoreductase n=1 Tax=Pseudomaricurvus sp. HS19 TaxID=2692626 RepID=UPI00136B3D99|nr:SDR family NAD(P)-dependent oxidoreductase [Pseudomaricurvus sp. HS19]MYM61898.1 SDR family NAD(P)-dependent oxidoreductase [Pseudomaricurvus sp. HS19]
MARVFITGSSDGLGFLAAEQLLADGHAVVVHARNTQRADELRARLPAALEVVVGDLSSVDEMRKVARDANRIGGFDAVIHNAGVLPLQRQITADGLSSVFAVNVLAPYVLTALMHVPARLVYLSSSMHQGASADLADCNWAQRQWSAEAAYSESKLLLTVLAFAVARCRPQVLCNAVDPGWVATKMGGPRATDDLHEGYRTQTWLAVSDDPAAQVSGKYFHHRQPHTPDARACDLHRQDELLALCQTLTGITLDGSGIDGATPDGENSGY